MADSSVMIVAGEASGDLHGAHLVAAMKEMQPQLTFCGVGGKELAVQGMESLYDAAKLAVVGISEVFDNLGDIRAAMRILEDRMRKRRPQLLVLIDFPDFNLMLAAKAKRLQIPVFYYISPQVWAWRSGRVRKIARLVDRMAVILPFEKEFYRQRGVDVDFVGHPLLDSVKPTLTRSAFLAKHDISPTAKVVGLLPGSRKREVAGMLPVFLEAAHLIKKEIQDVVFVIPLASTLSIDDLKRHGLHDTELDVRIIADGRYDLMAACDAVMAVSGTVTLELAILGVPMLVAYRISPLTYILGRLLVKVKYASLANLVAGREIVPELIQHQLTPEKIVQILLPFLLDHEKNTAMRLALAEVCRKLGEPGASKRAAALALELMA